MKRVYLEITNVCNLNCPFCTYEKGNRFLTLQEIDDYTSQILPYCHYIYLHILGEPLLHPDFEKILALLDRKGFYLQLVTNGTLLERFPDLLNHSCLRKLSISLHSMNDTDIDEHYFQMIDALLEQKTETVIELRFYDSKHLNQKLDDYLNKLKNTYGLKETGRIGSFLLKENVYIAFSELFRWPDIRDPVISEEGKCHGGIDMIAISSASDVTLCCLDPIGYNSLGNLKISSLSEILSSKEYIELTENMKNGKMTSELCRRCTYRLRFR